MKHFEVKIKTHGGHIERTLVYAKDEIRAFQEFYKRVDNGKFLIDRKGHPRYIDIGATEEIKVVDVEERRISEEKQKQIQNEKLRN